MRRRRAISVTVAALAVALATPGSASAFTPASLFDADDFGARSAHVDNPYLKLLPGMRFVYEGQVVEDGKKTLHKAVITVTNLTKVVDGVRTRVFIERDFEDGELIEREIAFHAQDRDGTVWHLGEYPEEFEEGKFMGAPSTWLAGVKKARPGVMMQAHPKTGTPEYQQGYAPAVDFDDRAKVTRSGLTAYVEGRTYHDVIEVTERSAVEPGDGKQLKFHAPGVGVVGITAKGGTAQETLVLTRVYRLSEEQMQTVNRTARAMNKRAYDVAEAVWDESAPLVRRG